MMISSSTFFMLTIGTFAILVGFQIYSLSNKIFCTFRSKDRGKEEKFVSAKAGTVTFSNGTYEIDPRRITVLKYKRGLMGFIGGLPVKSLDFTWSSRVAENPDDFSATWDTPEARKMADSTADWKGMNQGIDTQVGKKSSMMGGWMLYVAIGIIVLLAYFTYNNYTNVKAITKYLEASGNPNAAQIK